MSSNFSSARPLQLLSSPSQISFMPGLVSASVSSQSSSIATYPAGGVHAQAITLLSP